MLNIAIDFAIGLVPFAGDVADAMFRCNTKNAIVLEEHLREKGKKSLREAGKAVPSTDPSDPDTFEEVDSRGEAINQQPRRNNNMPSNVETLDGRSVPVSDGRTAQRSAAGPSGADTREPRQSGRFSSWLWSRLSLSLFPLILAVSGVLRYVAAPQTR